MDVKMYIIALLSVIIIILLILLHQKSSRKMNFKGAYLNYNSTNAKRNGQLNSSDLAYPQVLQSRSDMAELFVKIKKIIKAPPFAKVIINSGATESIAQCVFWAKCENNYGSIQGTDYDHSAVEDNCKTFDMDYDSTSLRKGKINDNCAGIFLTHVNSKTGEILNVNNFKRNVLDKYSYINTSNENNTFNKHVRQNKPLLFLDATQSIMKAPIEMEKWGINAVFFSLHKIGGQVGSGLLIINDVNSTFKPLISGKQQGGLRGGTYQMDTILENEFIFDEFDDFNTRKQSWQHAVEKLKAGGVNVYEPKTSHLYNTILIDLGHCPLGTINELARKNIYVGNISACANETEKENEKQKGGDVQIKPFEKAIRISYAKPEELTDDVLDKIIKEVNKPQE